MQENTDQKDSEYGHFSRSVFCEKCPATLLKKKLWRSCFPANFVKFLRTQFLQNTSGELFWLLLSQVSSWFVGNEAGGGRISKQVFKEHKAHQMFRGTNISYPLIRTVRFSENLVCFVFFKHPFWDSSFCLITNELLVHLILSSLNHPMKIKNKN